MNKKLNIVKKIKYPYLPSGRKIKYVDVKNPFMIKAIDQARDAYEKTIIPESKEMTLTSAVLVRGEKVISGGVNGDGFHQNNMCIRIKENMPSGVGYNLCPGCVNENHAERVAIRKAQEKGVNISGADLYLYGHWWCCEACWEVMIKVGIKNVYLLENSEILFDRDNVENIIKTQFE